MFKQLVNEMVLDLTLRPDGPVLIKSGIPSISGPDMSFVTTRRNGTDEVYFPGSSLKGVLRSHAERIARTLNSDLACNPFSKVRKTDAFCGNCFEARKDANESKKEEEKDKLSNAIVYSQSCPICRLFGSTWYAGRLATEDAYAVGTPPRPERRDGVGIDRFTGGAADKAKFELEVITGGEFHTRLHLRNFELWQLGLLGFVLNDLKDGLIRIGLGKSRGLGRVIGTVDHVRLDFLGPKAPRPENDTLTLKGVGELVNQELAEEYGMQRPDHTSVPAVKPTRADGLRTTYELSSETFPWADLAEKWLFKSRTYEPAEPMKAHRSGSRQ